MINAGKATNARIGLSVGDAGSVNARAAKFGIEGVANINGNLMGPARNGRLHGLGMDHLGTYPERVRIF